MKIPAWMLAAIPALAVAACASAFHADSSQCPATIAASDAALERLYVEFRQSVEAGPLVARFGAPVSCTARIEGGAVRLEYRFAHGEQLEAQRDPAIEMTEQRLTHAHLTNEMAIALLQRTEQWSFGAQGCHIPWTSPPQKESLSGESSHVLAYRGDVCNCQARLVYSGTSVEEIVFRSGC